MGDTGGAIPAPPNNPTYDVFERIEEERKRQDFKWGDQCDQLDDRWLTVLLEEVGEVAHAILTSRPEDPEHYEGWLHEMGAELIQVAAVAVAWVECIDRRIL